MLQVFWISSFAFTFISTLPPYLMKTCICFDTFLGTYPTVFPFLSLHTITYLSCTREDGSSSLLVFKISPSLGQYLKKVEPTNARLNFKCFYDNRRISSSTFSINISINGSILYVLFRSFITARCWLKFVCIQFYHYSKWFKRLDSNIMIPTEILRMNIMSKWRTLCCPFRSRIDGGS